MTNHTDFFAITPPKYVDFNGTAVKFPPELFYFAQARAVFIPEIQKAYDEAMESFDIEVGSLPSFVANDLSWFVEITKPLCEFAMKQLVAHGAYDMDEEHFFKKYVADDFDRITQIHESMSAQYARIRERQEARNEDRDSRRHWKNTVEDRSGLDQAIAFMVDKSISGFEELGNRSEYAAIYNDDTKEELKNEIRMIFFNVLEDFTLALHDSTGKDLRCPYPKEDIEKANRIFDKLQKNMIPESEWEKVALEIFQINPLQDGLLPWCVRTFLDKDGAFEEIAQLFHIQHEVTETKENMLKNLVDIDTEEKALESKEKLLAMEEALSYKSTVQEQTVQDALERFDLEARTVDGYTYKERSEAQKARQELKELQKLVDAQNLSSSKDYATLLEKINTLGLECFTSQKHIDELTQKMQEIAAQEKEKAEIEQLEHLSSEYSQLTANECETFVNCIENAGFTSQGALTIIQKAHEKMVAMQQREQWLAANCHMSAEEAVVTSRRMSIVSSLAKGGIKTIDPQQAETPYCLKIHPLPIGEAAFGFIDFGNKSAIILATKGVYVSIAKSTMATKLVSDGASLLGDAVKGFLKPKWKLSSLKDLASGAKETAEALQSTWDKFKEKDNEDINKFITWNELAPKAMEEDKALGLDSSIVVNLPKSLWTQTQTIVELLEKLK